MNRVNRLTCAIPAGAIAAAVLLSGCGAPNAAPTALPPADYKSVEQIEEDMQVQRAKEALGNAALEMKKMQKYALTLNRDKMKEAGRELQQRADEAKLEVDKVKDPAIRATMTTVVEGLKQTGEGAAELDPKKSMAGVNKTLDSFKKLP